MKLPISGDNSFFFDLYARYRKDRQSVPADWAVLFEEIDSDNCLAKDGAADLARDLIEAYRRFGHLEAKLCPLFPNENRVPTLVEMRNRAASAAERMVKSCLSGLDGFVTVGDIYRAVDSIYAGRAAIEVDHLRTAEERDWCYDAFERAGMVAPDAEELSAAFEPIVLADEFEGFMRRKFPTKKRFGIEGAETAIVFLQAAMESAARHGTDDIVMGGMHRGRLAIVAVVLRQSPVNLIAAIMGNDISAHEPCTTGDVPYHLGWTSDLVLAGRPVRVALLPHPSHLMAVAPVALGLAAARARCGSIRTMCILVHTDAAFAGQGLTTEVLQLGGLPGYSAGGTIHLVVNNQIGFTTLPSEGRSSLYCTDVGKIVGAPILHVNGDDPVAVARVARLAVEWRERFRKDILVDLVCYRRNGHNELDEPRFTQPHIWVRIDRQPGIREVFSEAVREMDETLAERAEVKGRKFRDQLHAAAEDAVSFVPTIVPLQTPDWHSFGSAQEEAVVEHVATGITLERLREIGLAGCSIPHGMDVHPKVRSFYASRAEAIESGEGINFATAEALGIGSLLTEGCNVRLSGQDAARGTFTQRHLVVHDRASNRTATPLAALARSEAGHLEVLNSPLSEYGALGFEYGFSLHAVDQLTIWEAQFGDFINGAQIVVDQYIASAEAKWKLLSALVVILPHGLEGQGPDHSSCRIERLTQLCSGGNVILAQPSTPANLFHLLRRQMRAVWRKPLFVFTPKSLLRSKAAVSRLDDMAEATSFRPIITEPCRRPDSVRRVVLCSGKIFFDLLDECRAASLRESIRLVRIEQVYPLHLAELSTVLDAHPNAELIWAQEEPENQGAWPYVRTELARSGIRNPGPRYVGRPAMPVCAAGSSERHEREQAEIRRRAVL